MATLRGEIRSFFDRLPTGEFSHHNQVLTPLALIVSKFIDDPQKASDLIEKLLENTNHRPHQANEVLNLVVGAKNHLANPNRPRTKRVRTEIDSMNIPSDPISFRGMRRMRWAVCSMVMM